jgi:hypothetical protein
MCTLSVIAGAESYLLAMNRDERIARGAGELPRIHHLGGSEAIYPNDGAGGTWIAANEHGIGLALLNWNDVACFGVDTRPAETRNARSRGQLIPALVGSRSLPELRSAFAVLDLDGILPFRLVGVFPSEKEIGEWRWDSAQLEFQVHAWESRHWFSSSLSDKQAESLRGAVCRSAKDESDAGSVPWLRRLHASHANGPRPFSLCVHREDVRTLSYTEITCTAATVTLQHFLASPCRMRAGHWIETQRVPTVDSPANETNSRQTI